MRAKESLNRNLMWLSEELLELVSVVKLKLHIDFSLELRGQKNLKSICTCQENSDSILKAFKNNSQLVTLSL
jgi:hypothetical protein